MEIKGKVVANLGVQNGTSKAGKNWAKATVVIEYGDQYPKKVALDNMKNADSFGALPVGTEGTFHIEVESREFNGRWYTSVNCWKWETTQQAPAQPSQPVQQDWQAAYPQPAAKPQTASQEDGGLPF
jgi:hypothetical protein